MINHGRNSLFASDTLCPSASGKLTTLMGPLGVEWGCPSTRLAQFALREPHSRRNKAGSRCMPLAEPDVRAAEGPPRLSGQDLSPSKSLRLSLPGLSPLSLA